MLKFNCLKFSELTVNQLYDILALRADVFVVDQQCVYLDPDGKDKSAMHLLGVEDQQIAAYARLFPPENNQIIFGRVATAKSVRGKGYGKLLMQELIDYCDKHYSNTKIKCSAQLYLKKFYEDFGFIAQGNVYEEDMIPHIAMYKL